MDVSIFHGQGQRDLTFKVKMVLATDAKRALGSLGGGGQRGMPVPAGHFLAFAEFGAGLFVLPHGLHVDDDGNVWVTDSQGNAAGTKGHQVIKFSPEGEILMRLGVAGQPGTGPGYLYEPCDVITAPNGDIFVSDGHNGQSPDPPEGSTARILKFDSEGNFIKEWGEIGFRPGQFRTPHAMEFDSQGRLYVADRGNHRIQIFDQEGELLESYTQYSRISGLFITADDTLYAIDSESGVGNHPGLSLIHI